MSQTFKFRCPTCRRKYKANKDVAGRLKTCGNCSTSFVVREAAPPPKKKKKKKGNAEPYVPPPPPMPRAYEGHPVAEAVPVGSPVGTMFTVLLIFVALGAGGYFLKEIYFPPKRAATAKAPTLFMPAPAPTAASAKKLEWVEIAEDGIVLMDDGEILRGRLEKANKALRVRRSGESRSIEPGQVGSFHVEAPVFIRGELRKLENISELATNATRATPAPGREAMVPVLLELYRQGDRWALLEPLCAASELPSKATPIGQIEKLKTSIEEILRKSGAKAVAETPAPATTPAAAPAAPKAAPKTPAATALLSEFSPDLGAAERLRLAGDLRAVRAQRIPQADLIHFAFLFLARTEADWGLRTDRLEIESAQINQHYEGALQTQGDYFAQLTLPTGGQVTAYKEKSAWIAHIPGGMRLEKIACRTSKDAETPSRRHLIRELEAFPPVRWLNATGAEHLASAKSTARSLTGKGRPDARGRALLRYLAAAQAAAALRLGTPDEISAARSLLQELGYAESEDGRWVRAEDRRAVRIGVALREGRADKADALLPDAKSRQDFAGRYRAMAVRLSLPQRDKEDLAATVQAIDRALRQALTVTEASHLRACKKTIETYGVCGHCGGSATRICTTCKGKGKLTQGCSDCNALGYRIIAGIDGGAKTCPSCRGTPIRGTIPCERCEGDGSLSCRKCDGPFRLPQPHDLSRLRNCSLCEGEGRHGDAVMLACPRCAGLGAQLVPAGDAERVLQ